ncbi:MAG: PEP/pyruvate-binding domain-containing protein [Ignavibacteriales bacterium]|nr:PEP/pyruvate-binding domain-containing protein [Ignavibacteriales bacterium]
MLRGPRHPARTRSRAGRDGSRRTTPSSSARRSSITFLVQNGVLVAARAAEEPDHLPARALERGAGGASSPAVSRTASCEQFQGMLDYFGESPYIVRSSSHARGQLAATPSPASTRASSAPTSGSREERHAGACSTAVRTRLRQRARARRRSRYRARRGLLDSEEQHGAAHHARVRRAPRPLLLPAGGRRRPLLQPLRLAPRHRSRGRRRAARLRPGHPRGRPLRRRLHAAGRAQRARPAGPRRTSTTCAEHSQRRMDCLDLAARAASSRCRFRTCSREKPDFPLDLYLTRHEAKATRSSPSTGCSRRRRSRRDLRRMLAHLEAAYEHPVDIEFTLNFLADGTYRIHLLQCRTFQVQRRDGRRAAPTRATRAAVCSRRTARSSA